jgi:DNA-binding response OmpR family regulator
MMTHKIHVVAIDDVADILDLLEYNLTKEGMQVTTFTDSAEALAYLHQNQVDVVVSDWMMPDPNGLEVCKSLKAHESTKNIPLIMLTCKGSLTDYKDAMDAGAADYVVKPVRMEELVRRIKLVLPNPYQRVKFG